MRLLALDLSSSTGFAVFDVEDGKEPVLVHFGNVSNDCAAYEYAPHPYGYVKAAQDMADKLLLVYDKYKPDKVAIEEINVARARFSQKFIDYIHFAVLTTLPLEGITVYIDTSQWRRTMGVQLSKEDKAQNAKLSKAKRDAKNKGQKLDKKKLGIAGKITIKHVAVRRVNELYNLNFTVGDNDAADAILEGAAVLKGAKICNGRSNGKAEE